MRLVVFILISSVCVVNCYQKNPLFKPYKDVWQGLLLKHLDHCVTDSGVDPVLAIRLLPHGEYVDDPKLKCFMKCLHFKLGIGNEDGTAKVENFLKDVGVVDPVIMDEGYLIHCLAIKLSDPCETAFKVSQCVHSSVGKAIEALHLEL